MEVEEIMTENYTSRRSTGIRGLVLTGAMAALICVMGPFALPIGPIPITLANLGIYLAAYILGSRRGTVSCLIYLLIGFIGVPVFANFTAGAGKLLGPTGGYLIGFILMAFVTGYFAEKFPEHISLKFFGMVLGTALTYAVGSAWLAYQAGMSFEAALAAGVIPFILGDVLKMVISILLGTPIKKQLVRAGLLD